jgi:hypothetical protein
MSFDSMDARPSDGHVAGRPSALEGAPRHRRRRMRVEPGFPPPYEHWTKDALYHRAKEAGIEGRLQMNKTDLIEALRGMPINPSPRASAPPSGHG